MQAFLLASKILQQLLESGVVVQMSLRMGDNSIIETLFRPLSLFFVFKVALLRSCFRFVPSLSLPMAVPFSHS